MSNYDLQSKLNQLQGELRQAERVNAELRGELSTVEQGVNRAHRDLEDYNDKIRGTLDNCNGTMTSSHQRVIDAIHSADGFVVLAHPMAYKLTSDEVTNIISKLSDLGIDGVEVYQSDCSVGDSLYLMQLADKFNLLQSVGSDFHRNFNSDGRMIGKGIDNNLCIEETSLTNKLLSLKKDFRRNK